MSFVAITASRLFVIPVQVVQVVQVVHLSGKLPQGPYSGIHSVLPPPSPLLLIIHPERTESYCTSVTHVRCATLTKQLPSRAIKAL